MIQILNGRWTTQHGEPLTTPEQHQQFADKLISVKQYANGKRLTHHKINILFNILESNDSTDSALTKLLAMNGSQIKNLFR
jgi:hypothetical protein